MRNPFSKLIPVFIGLFTYVLLLECPLNGRKTMPIYEGVDRKVLEFVQEYKELAKEKGIIFSKDVSIGFKKIKSKNVVGLTTYGSGWREIDLDSEYWENSTNISRKILIFHELTHAYCTRGHTYGNNTKYKEDEGASINETSKGGYYTADGCPLSLMYPYVVEEGCMRHHYYDYISEIFNNCEPF